MCGCRRKKSQACMNLPFYSLGHRSALANVAGGAPHPIGSCTQSIPSYPASIDAADTTCQGVASFSCTRHLFCLLTHAQFRQAAEAATSCSIAAHTTSPPLTLPSHLPLLAIGHTSSTTAPPPTPPPYLPCHQPLLSCQLMALGGKQKWGEMSKVNSRCYCILCWTLAQLSES